jgi:hypothetical protein
MPARREKRIKMSGLSLTPLDSFGTLLKLSGKSARGDKGKPIAVV